MLKRAISSLILSGSNHSNLMQKASQKLEQRNNILTKHRILLNTELSSTNLSLSEQKRILSLPVYQLSRELKDGKTTSVKILLTYFNRVSKFGVQFNLITESNFSAALASAKACDAHLQTLTTPEQRESLSPFFGIPISLKDMVIQEGFDSTLGMIKFANCPHKSDGLLLRLFKNTGAIPFVRSTMPQIGLLMETVSHLWGVSRNPWDPSRTVGGSSGGEAGLIAAQCSPFGVGTDVGGSIRTPALYNGIYGLKPTDQRLTYNGVQGAVSSNQNRLVIKSCSGPMGKCVEDLALFMREMCNQDLMHQLDPITVPLKWREDLYRDDFNNSSNSISKKKKKVAFIRSLQYMGASDANRRAVDMAVEVLKKKGNEVVELQDLPKLKEASNNFYSIIGSENSLMMIKYILQGENLYPSYFDNAIANMLPAPIKQIVALILEKSGEKRAADIVRALGQRPFYMYQKLAMMQKRHREQVNQFFIDNNFDAVITPGSALPAYKHDQSSLSLQVFYAAYWNYINFPTGAMPITTVRHEEENYVLNKNCVHNDKYFRLAQQCLKGAAGMPVGIQVSARPFQEEICLNIMKQIEDGVQFNEHPKLEDNY